MRSFAVSLYVLALTNVAFSAPTPADVHSKVVCRIGRSRGHHRSTMDRNGGFPEPFGEGDNCIDAEGDRFNDRHFGEGRGRFGDESVGNGGFGPDGDRVREDHFGEDPLDHDSRPDDRFHGDWEHGVEQDGGKQHGSDESGSKQSDGKHTHGKYPKSDGPHSVRKIPPRALGEFSGNGNGEFADGEKFGDLQPKYVEGEESGDLQPKYVEGEESGGQQPRIYADGEQIGERPKSSWRNTYYPIKYSYDSYHPRAYLHRTPHDTHDFSPSSQIRANNGGLLGGTIGLTGVGGILNGGDGGVLGPFDSIAPAKRTARHQ